MSDNENPHDAPDAHDDPTGGLVDDNFKTLMDNATEIERIFTNAGRDDLAEAWVKFELGCVIGILAKKQANEAIYGQTN